MKKKWNIKRPDGEKVSRLASSLGLTNLVSSILVSRGIDSAEAAETFLHPDLASLPDPFVMNGMEAAVSRISSAIENREKIGVFGDYDVDGVTGAALLTNFFRESGIEALTILPNRSEGYGLLKSHVQKFKEAGTELLITVDNGIRAVEEAELTGRLGIDLIITDHHEIGESVPKACAILNPHIDGTGSPFTNLCGCGVAFMLLLALRKHMRDHSLFRSGQPNLKKYLDLVALGTVADVVPLTGTNRTLVKYGLQEITRAPRPGIAALLDISATSRNDVSPGSIGFRLAPRLNAAGRIGDAMKALEILTTEDEVRAASLAVELDAANRARQSMEKDILDEIESATNADPAIISGDVAVLDSDRWHVGVIGIIATRIAEKFGVPAFIISTSSEPARGSARSVEGINLVDMLSRCSDDLLGYGGHPMAAGITIKKEDISKFKNRISGICSEAMSNRLQSEISIDAVADPSEISKRLIEELDLLKPFGCGNPEPVLKLENASIVTRRIVGVNHLKMLLKTPAGNFDSIGFELGEMLPQEAKNISLAFVPRLNDWNGTLNLQLKIRDLMVEE